jgi:hypothetical protein
MMILRRKGVSRYVITTVRYPFFNIFLLYSMISLIWMWGARPSPAASLTTFEGIGRRSARPADSTGYHRPKTDGKQKTWEEEVEIDIMVRLVL